jgi:membrane peptidoglycan carboxypeptidase
VLWEDPAFYHHSGLDYPEIARAAWTDLHTASYRRGASTITQQVAKNIFLGPEKTLRRKVREAILAERLERALPKDEILTVYLKIAGWGDGIVGAEAASQRYFGKSASDLNWAEAAQLAAILPSPRLWNPCKNPARAKEARREALAKLLSSQSLSQQEFEAAEFTPRSTLEPGSRNQPSRLDSG